MSNMLPFCLILFQHRNTKNAGTCLQNIEQLVKPVCKDLPKYATQHQQLPKRYRKENDLKKILWEKDGKGINTSWKVLLFSILYLPPVQAPCVPGMLTQAGAPLSRNSNKLRRSWYSSSSWLIQNLSLGDFTSFANLDFGHLWWEVSEVREPKKSLDAILGDNNSGKCPWHARPKATSEVSALGTFMCQDSPKPLQKK